MAFVFVRVADSGDPKTSRAVAAAIAFFVADVAEAYFVVDFAVAAGRTGAFAGLQVICNQQK